MIPDTSSSPSRSLSLELFLQEQVKTDWRERFILSVYKNVQWKDDETVVYTFHSTVIINWLHAVCVWSARGFILYKYFNFVAEWKLIF